MQKFSRRESIEDTALYVFKWVDILNTYENTRNLDLVEQKIKLIPLVLNFTREKFIKLYDMTKPDDKFVLVSSRKKKWYQKEKDDDFVIRFGILLAKKYKNFKNGSRLKHGTVERFSNGIVLDLETDELIDIL